MNYRHAYHAGNFADVVKHASLALVIERLKAKDKPFRIIDTHAGIGLYDLAGPQAAKTEEWERGIGRLLGPDLSPRAMPKRLAAALAPYLEAVRAVNPDGRLRHYPGSPKIARHLMRAADRLTAVELHPEDFEQLAATFAGDFHIKTIALDGWLALGSFVPPKERRGLVLVDPPYEAPNEFETLVDSFVKAYRRWPTGVYALWYPIKDGPAVKRFWKALEESGVPRILAAELWVRERLTADRFNGTGLILCNPPYQLDRALDAMLADLVPLLAEDRHAGQRVSWIRGED